MALNLIALEQSFAKEAAAEAAAKPEIDDTTPAEGDGESEGDAKPDAKPKDGEAEPVVDDDAEPDDAADKAKAEARAIADDDELDIDGEKVTVGKLKQERLMQADYTKKTQALADERKKLAEKDAEREADLEEVRDWVRSFGNPDELGFQIAGYFPDALEQFLTTTVTAVAKGVGFDETAIAALKEGLERAAFRLAKEGSKKVQEQDGNKQKARQEKRDKAAADAEQAATLDTMRRNFAEWSTAALKANGLYDPKNEADTAENAKLVHALIVDKIQSGKLVDKDDYLAAAKRIAQKVGKAPQGKTAPPSPRPGSGPSAKSGNGKKPTPKKDSAGFFDSLREKHGAT